MSTMKLITQNLYNFSQNVRWIWCWESRKAGKPNEFHVGFADFSEYIASDDHLSLYKGFPSLGARNLLYLQAELQVLEKELKLLDDRDQLCVRDTEDDDERRMIDVAARVDTMWSRERAREKTNGFDT